MPRSIVATAIRSHLIRERQKVTHEAARRRHRGERKLRAHQRPLLAEERALGNRLQRALRLRGLPRMTGNVSQIAALLAAADRL